MLLDTNNDGIDDIELDGADLPTFDSTQPVGTFVTAQFDLKSGNGFIDPPRSQVDVVTIGKKDD
jgi:hypothetical protein